MAYAHRHAKITISGTMFGGSEIWSTGFHMGNPTGDATPPSEAFLSAVNTAWKTFFQNVDHQISDSYKTAEIRGAIVRPDGTTDPSTVKHHYVTVPYGGNAPGNLLPPQLALVATLTNSTPRGIASKGRMYLPGLTSQIQGDGRIATAQAQRIATGLKTFFDQINGVFDGPGPVINASKGTKAGNYADGISRAVTGVRVGNVYDTQRRRRNQLVEIYSFANLL